MTNKASTKLSYTKKMSVFFVCTNREFEERDLETCIFQFLNKTPSSKYKFDLILCFNKILEQDSLDHLV